MSRCPSSLAAAAAVLAMVSICSPSALAQDASPSDPSSVSLAERRAAEAFTAYNKKEYAAAIALYLEAYDAAATGSILYNIARIYDLKLHNRPSAIAFYRRYVADSGAQTDLIDISNQRLHELRGAEITTARVADDGSIAHDGATTPHAGAPLSRTERDTAEERHDGWSPRRWTTVALGAAGLVAVGVGGGFGLAAMSKASTAKDQCDGNACSQRGVDAARTAHRDATVANIGFAAGGALLLGGVALFFLGNDNTGEESHVHLEARATPSTTSLQVVGRW